MVLSLAFFCTTCILDSFSYRPVTSLCNSHHEHSFRCDQILSSTFILSQWKQLSVMARNDSLHIVKTTWRSHGFSVSHRGLTVILRYAQTAPRTFSFFSKLWWFFRPVRSRKIVVPSKGLVHFSEVFPPAKQHCRNENRNMYVTLLTTWIF